jgi:hypothetical protein
VVERKHQRVVELSVATMLHASIPHQHWPEIFESVIFIINQLPSSAISFQIPFQLLFKKTPDYQFFKVLGCRCYPYTRPYAAHKLEPRSIDCVFLGYSSLYKGYKCLDLTTNRVYIFRHVIFDEQTFPFIYRFRLNLLLPLVHTVLWFYCRIPLHQCLHCLFWILPQSQIYQLPPYLTSSTLTITI